MTLFKKFKKKLKIKPSKIIVIFGPTASGKSELAVKIAKKFNGEIISADSRQVYKGLDIGSGKIAEKEMLGVPHYLLDVASPKRTFTVAQYQKLAKKALKDIIKRGKVPIICGGTGLYINALIYDYQFPKAPPQPKLRKQLEKKTTEELFQQLKKLDPRRAKNIDKYNRRRLIRALEICLTTGQPIPLLKSGVITNHNAIAYDVLKIGIKKSPRELKKLIKKRLLRRLKIGMIDEVKKLRQQGLSWQRLDNLGLEYRYISRYLRGLIPYNEMVDALIKEIWHYARRQMTWFTHQNRNKKILWIKNQKEAEKLVRNFLNYPTSKVE